MKNVITLFVLLFSIFLGHSQGFVNLDFEFAKIDYGGSYQNFVTNAFPGWTVNAPYIFYDDTSLSGGSISIFDTNPPYSLSPIQGKYFVWFFGSGPDPNYGSISLGQTGMVPSGSQSISFWGSYSGLQITFNGQPLDFLVTGTTPNYNIYTADISAFAGQTGQLLFTAPLGSANSFIDNIQFSSSAVPEPSIFALAALGGLVVGLVKKRLPRRL